MRSYVDKGAIYLNLPLNVLDTGFHCQLEGPMETSITSNSEIISIKPLVQLINSDRVVGCTKNGATILQAGITA